VPTIGRQFYFPFSHSTRVDVAVAHLGDSPTGVEICVYRPDGERVHRRRLMDVPSHGAVTTRKDPKSDNLARFVGPHMGGLVSIRGDHNALLTASSLCIGKGLTSCALLRPLQAAAGAVLQAPVAIGRSFLVLVANPHDTRARVRVEVAPSGEPFSSLQEPLQLGRHQLALSEDAFSIGQPGIVRVVSETGVPILVWGLGVGAERSELYPLYP